MSDQCRHCTLRGDIKKCKSTECFHHENWYAKEQQKLINELQEGLKSAWFILDNMEDDRADEWQNKWEIM